MASEMNEKRALARLRRGDEAALAWFIRRYTPYVSAIVWNIAGHAITAQDAEEIAADVFLALWRYRDRPDPEKVQSYLGRIARSRALNRLRSLGRDTALEYDELELAVPGAEDEALRAEGRERLRRALERMDSRDREIFTRHYWYGETSAAIAARLGMSDAAVRKRLERGRQALRRELEKEM